VKKKKVVRKKAVRKKTTESAWIQCGKEHWPLEHDVLFRPDRFSYVRKLVKAEGCVFCTAASKKPTYKTLCVYQSKHSMVVINKFPYNSGHMLVMPKRHTGDILDLSQAEFEDLQNLIRTTVRAINDLYQPAGFNLGLNHGAVAGAGIPEHLHYHLIPRWAGDLNFFPLIAKTKVVIENLELTFKRMLEYFKSHE
jgi:ATP adenylyltransferase